MTYEEAMKNCIFRFCSGSRAYGTNREDSDFDYRGVFIAPLVKSFDLFQSNFIGSGTIGQRIDSAIKSIDNGEYISAREHLVIAKDPENEDLSISVGTVHKVGVDEELQELRKFFKLAAESNPNIIEFLYVDRLITLETDVWKKIRSNRELFLSKRSQFTFSGYAISQLKRIEGHRGYLLNPPSHKPTREEFGLPNETTIPLENRRGILSVPDKYVKEEVRENIRKEKAYDEALKKYKSYKDWESKRNPLRKELEHKWGFDCKHAMHLIRLIRMASEIAETGQVNVYRQDAEELKSIRDGGWSYEKIIEYVKEMELSLVDKYKKSTLRNKPDHKRISELYKEICEEYYGIKIK